MSVTLNPYMKNEPTEFLPVTKFWLTDRPVILNIIGNSLCAGIVIGFALATGLFILAEVFLLN